mmetsp:Transcript_29014/g.73666  ORF Transcript_29014/g.73666 Transcript_29014/m.73666 type:complete len:581 (+) Transcript_29014:153-1895(+)
MLLRVDFGRHYAELRRIQRRGLAAAVHVAARAQVLVQLPHVRNGVACRLGLGLGRRRRRVLRGRRLGLAATASLATAGGGAARRDDIVDGRLAGLGLARRVRVRRVERLLRQRYLHFHLDLILQILDVLFQQGELIEGQVGFQRGAAKNGRLLALEGGEGPQVLPEGLQGRVRHQGRHDVLPLRLGRLVRLHVVLRDQRQFARRVPIAQELQHRDLPLGVRLGDVDHARLRLPLLPRLLGELDEVVGHLVIDVHALGDHSGVHGLRGLGEPGVKHRALLAQDRPAVLTEVRADGAEDDHLPLQVPHCEALVRLRRGGLADVPVLIERGQELKVARPQGLAVIHAGVEPLALLDEAIQLVRKPPVREEPVVLAFPQWLLALDDRLHGLYEDGEGEQRLVGNALIEVGRLQRVAGVGQGEAHGVRRVLHHDVFQGKEVALGLRHLLVVDQQPAVAEEALRPHVRLLLPDARVVVEGHGQVVLDQVLARDAQVHRIPEPELLAHGLQRLLGDLALRQLALQEHVVPDLRREVLGLDARCGALRAVQVALQKVRDGVVGHVDRAVGQRLDDELLVPRDFGAEAE